MAAKLKAFAVYRHFDAEGKLLYVGMSLNPIARLITHRSLSRWAYDIARIDVEWFETKEEAADAEFEAQAKEKPKHNNKFTGGTPEKRAAARAKQPRERYFPEVGEHGYPSAWEKDQAEAEARMAKEK